MAVSNRDVIMANMKRKSSAEAPVVQAPQRSTTSSWHMSSQPTEAETVAQIYRVAQQDRQRGEQAYSLYQKAKAEGAWNDPYSKPTTKYGELVGIDPITLNDDNIRSLVPYLQKGVQTASGGLSSAKGNGSEAVNAYNLSNLMQDYENTKAYLAEQDEIVKEAQYWIRKGLSDDEIKAKLNIGGEGTKYTKIKNAIDKAAVGEVVRTTSPLWAATSYGVDSMLWGLRNPGQSTGDKFMDAVQMELGRGNAYVRDEAKMSRLDATSESYNPYMVGTTMDDLAIKYGVDRFDKAWIDQNRALLNNPETAGDYSKIYAAIENTDLLQAEAERFKGELARYVERGEFPDYDKLLREGTIYGDSFDNLVKLDESLKSGKLIATTDAIDFDLNTLKAETDRAVQLKQNQLKAASDLEAANKLAEEEKKNWFAQAAEAIGEGLATIGGWLTTPKETVEPPKALADETPEEAIAEGATMFSPQVSALAQNGDPGAAAEVANAELAGILEQNPELLTTDNTQKAAIFMMALAGEAGILTDPEQQEKAKVYQDAVTTSMSVDMNSEESKNFLGWLDDVLQTGGTLVAAQENEGLGAQMTAMLLVDRFMARGADVVENIVGAGIAGLGELLNNEWLIDYGKRTMEYNDQVVAHYDAVVARNGTPLEILAVQQGSEIAHMMQMGSLSKAVSAYNAIKTGGAVNFMTRALMGTPFALESGGSTLQETYAETGNYTTAVAAGLTATSLTTLLSQWDGILKNIEANGMPYLSEVVEKLGSVPGSGAKACVARWGKGAGMWLMNGLKTIVNESAQEAVEGGATDILVGLIKGENLSEMDWEKFGKDRLTDAVGSVFLSLGSAVSTMPTYARSVKVAESQMRKSDMTAQDMKTFVEAVKEDLQDPAIVAEMDKRAEAIAVETRTGELIAEGAMGDEVEREQQIGWLSQVANNILYLDTYKAPEKLGANAELSSKISDEFRPLVDALDTASLELKSAEKEYAAAAQARSAAYQAFRNEPHNPDLKRKADEALAERKRLNEKVRDAKTKVEAAVEAVQSKQRDIQTAAATKLEEIRGQAKTEVQQRVQEIRQFNYSDVDTEANVATVSQMESVVDLTGDEFALGGKTLVQDVTNYYEQEYGGMAQNPVLGDVLLTRRGAKDSLAHGITPQKAIAYAAVPEVVKNGQIIDIERNWKKKQIDTFAIAAPIRIMSGDNAGEYYMAVVVQRSQDNQRFYVHDVLLQENKTEGPDATFKPEGVTEPLPAAEEVTSGVTKDPTLQSLLEKVRDVKKGNAPSEIQRTQVAPQTARGNGNASGKLVNPVKSARKLASALNIGERIGTRKMNNMPQAVLGYYNNRSRYLAVRSNEAGNITVTMHEVGHALAQRLNMAGSPAMVANLPTAFAQNYNANELPGEAFAEFVWRYMTDDAQAEAFAGTRFIQQFEQALRMEGLADAVHAARDEMHAYVNAAVNDQIGSMIVDRSQKERSTIRQWFTKTLSGLADSTAALEQIDHDIRGRNDGQLAPEDSLRDVALMPNTAEIRAHNLLTGTLTDSNWDIVGDSLATVIERTGMKGSDFDLLNRYMLALHSIDREAQGLPVFDDSISLADRQRFITDVEQNHTSVARAAEAIHNWWHNFMQLFMVDTGYLTQETLDRFEQMYPHYVPTNRVKKKGVRRPGEGGSTYRVRRATGSTEEIYNPIDTIVQNVNTIVKMVSQNNVGLVFDSLYNQYDGLGVYARNVTADMHQDHVDTTILRDQIENILMQANTDQDAMEEVLNLIGNEQTQWRTTGNVNLPNVMQVRLPDGTRRFYEFSDNEIFKAVSGWKEQDARNMWDYVGRFVNGMTALTTGSNPLFGTRNFMRDFQKSVNYGSWATSYVDGTAKWLRAAYEVWCERGEYAQYKALGGGGWTRINANTKKGADEYRGELFKGYNTSNVGRTVKWAGRKLWNTITLAKLNEVVEQTSRYAEYRFGKQEKDTAAGRRKAFLNAQEVTVDFTRSGNSATAAALKKVIPFFNASVQGVYQTGREFLSESERGRLPARFAKTVINTALSSAMASVALLKYMDDDDKEEFFWLSDDLKAEHIYIPNFAPEILGDTPLIRIPLAQDPLSRAVHGAVTNAIWSGEGDETVIEASVIAENILNGFNPISGTVFDPLISVLSNKNWYGSNIVPTRMKDWDQTTQHTEETPTAFVDASRWLDAGTGGKVSVSPMMLEYLAEQYTGFLGQLVIPAISRNAHTGEMEGIDATIAEARKKLTSDPLVSNDVVNAFYDASDILTQVKSAYANGRPANMLRRGLTQAEAVTAAEEAKGLLSSKGAVGKAKKMISETYDRIDEIEADTSLTDKEKYRLTSEYRREMLEQVVEVNEVLGEYMEKYVNGDNVLMRFFEGTSFGTSTSK